MKGKVLKQVDFCTWKGEEYEEKKLKTPITKTSVSKRKNTLKKQIWRINNKTFNKPSVPFLKRTNNCEEDLCT